MYGSVRGALGNQRFYRDPSFFYWLSKESGHDDLLREQDSGARERERDSDQDAGEAGGETAGDCLDLDEEKGGI